jgi:ribosomal protein L17
MATKGAQPGNKNASHDKPWAAAIRRAVMRATSAKDKAQKLDRLAEKLIAEGLDGNTQALREIGDRLDGKPAQAITGADGGPITVELVRFGAGPASE